MRWLYIVALVLLVSIGILALHPGTAFLVRWQAEKLTHYTERKKLYERFHDPYHYIIAAVSQHLYSYKHFTLRYQAETRRYLQACEPLLRAHPGDAQIATLHILLKHATDNQQRYFIPDVYFEPEFLPNLVMIIDNPHFYDPPSSPLSPKVVADLRALYRRFPSEKGLLAFLLLAEANRLGLKRKEVQNLFFYRLGQTGPAGAKFWHLGDRRNEEAGRRVLALAREGERLEPENGFFTWMRAIALLELGRDTEAFQALQEAARKPRWNDHRAWFIEAQYRLMTHPQIGYPLRSAEKGFSEQFADTATNLPFCYTLATRLFVGLAAAHEERGEWRKGLTIRMALARTIAQMRHQQSSVDWISQSADLLRLVGLFPARKMAPPEHKADRATRQYAYRLMSEARCNVSSALRWGFFLNTLRERGFTREAEWLENELRTNQRTEALLQQFGERLSGYPGWWWMFRERWQAMSHRWALVGAFCLWLALLTLLGAVLTSVSRWLRMPDAVLLTLLFTLGAVGAFSLVLSDAGARIVHETLVRLRELVGSSGWSFYSPYPHAPVVLSTPASPASRKQQFIHWLLDNPHALQMALGVLTFVLLLMVVLLIALVQHRRSGEGFSSLKSAVWASCILFLLAYLGAVGNYFALQRHYLDVQRGCQMGGSAYVSRVTGQPVPAPQPLPQSASN